MLVDLCRLRRAGRKVDEALQASRTEEHRLSRNLKELQHGQHICASKQTYATAELSRLIDAHALCADSFASLLHTQGAYQSNVDKGVGLSLCMTKNPDTISG